jgi:hypothetical protein
MTTTIPAQGIPPLEFPIERPPPQYPVVGKYDAGRIVTHEPRFEKWMVDDVVEIDGRYWHVLADSGKNRGWDVTAELADIEQTQDAESYRGQV